jgi:hypothetical protein
MGRDLALERTWQERIRQHEQSGLTIRAFCEREGLVVHQFSWWRRELRRRAKESAPATKHGKSKKRSRLRKTSRQKPTPEAAFVPVQISHSTPPPSAVEIILDRPPRIRVSGDVDTERLREVIRVLEQF